jgi:hypothetical protein
VTSGSEHTGEVISHSTLESGGQSDESRAGIFRGGYRRGRFAAIGAANSQLKHGAKSEKSGRRGNARGPFRREIKTEEQESRAPSVRPDGVLLAPWAAGCHGGETGASSGTLVGLQEGRVGSAGRLASLRRHTSGSRPGHRIQPRLV